VVGQAGRGWVRQRGNGKYIGISGKCIRHFTPALARAAFSTVTKITTTHVRLIKLFTVVGPKVFKAG